MTTVEVTEESLSDSGVYPRIHGQSQAGIFTLDDCFRTQRTGFFGGLDTERIHVHHVFKGAWFGTGEELLFQKILVQMDWLAYWVMQSGLEESLEFTEREDGIENRSVVLAVRPIAATSFDGPDGSVITLGHNYGVAGDGIVERRLTQDFYFSVSHEETVSLAQLEAEAGALQDLISMGTARTAAFSKVTLRNPDVVDNHGEVVRELPIEHIAQWSTGVNPGTTHLMEHQMFFTLPDIGGTAGIGRWLKVQRLHRSAVDRVMSSRYAKEMMVSDRLLNCAASLEAYDRNKHDDDIYYIDRLRRCMGLAGSLFQELVGDLEEWAKRLKDARNTVAHHGSRLDGASAEHFFLSESAYWLFTLCLLRDSVAPEAAFDRMKAHSKFRWLRRELAAVLQAPGG